MEGGNRSIRKSARRTNVKRSIRPCLDRISSLPDSVLCHILSFIPSKASVATSVLARRWRFLWTQVMSVEFDADYMDIEAFPGTLNRFLLLNTVRLQTFTLSLGEWFTQYEVDTWISAAAVRNVQVFDFNDLNKFRMPHYLAYSKTLVEFRLSNCEEFCMGTFCLPNLKKIYFDHVIIEKNETLSNLISGCLVLEDLTILNVLHRDGFHISSPTLKRLKLESLPNEYIFFGPVSCSMRLNTPALQYLDKEDHLSNHVSAQELSSLIEARIELCNEDLTEDVLYLSSIFDFVERVSMVKFLTLSCPLEMKLISTTFSTSTTKFENLTELNLEADWHFLTRFLESADNLEVLIIREVKDKLRCWRTPEKVPVCLLSSLTTVKIYQCGWKEPDFEMVRYILRNARVLKRMEIHFNRFGSHSRTKSKTRRRIIHFRRGSKACKIDFYGL